MKNNMKNKMVPFIQPYFFPFLGCLVLKKCEDYEFGSIIHKKIKIKKIISSISLFFLVNERSHNTQINH